MPGGPNMPGGGGPPGKPLCVCVHRGQQKQGEQGSRDAGRRSSAGSAYSRTCDVCSCSNVCTALLCCCAVLCAACAR